MDLLTEVRARVAEMRAAAVAGGRLQPPLLILGTSERVGSNWLSDTLGRALLVSNEPLRQQLGIGHPLAALNPHPRAAASVDVDQLGPYGWHALVVAAANKYTPTGQVRCAVKETNLYGSVALPLVLWPDAPIVVASRSPLGVASSFTRSKLIRRFDYRAAYQRLASLARTHLDYQRWASLFPSDRPDDLTVLLRLVVLNAALLAEAVADRPNVLHVPYEAAVHDQAAALARISSMFGTPLPADPDVTLMGASGDDTFATTNSGRGLVAHLDQPTARRHRVAARSGPVDSAGQRRRCPAPLDRRRRPVPALDRPTINAGHPGSTEDGQRRPARPLDRTRRRRVAHPAGPQR